MKTIEWAVWLLLLISVKFFLYRRSVSLVYFHSNYFAYPYPRVLRSLDTSVCSLVWPWLSFHRPGFVLRYSQSSIFMFKDVYVQHILFCVPAQLSNFTHFFVFELPNLCEDPLCQPVVIRGDHVKVGLLFLMLPVIFHTFLHTSLFQKLAVLYSAGYAKRLRYPWVLVLQNLKTYLHHC